MADPEPTELEVDVLPAEAEQLALTESGAQSGDVERLEPVVLEERRGRVRKNCPSLATTTIGTPLHAATVTRAFPVVSAV